MSLSAVWIRIRAALWGYSVIMLLIFMLIEFIPHQPRARSSDVFGGVLVLAPIFLFIVSAVIEFTRYQWNWWRYLLGGYTVLITAFIIFVATRVDSHPHPHHSNTPFGAALLLLPIFLFFLTIKRKSSKNKKSDLPF